MGRTNESNTSSSLNLILAGALVLTGVFVAITVVSVKSHADDIETTVKKILAEPSLDDFLGHRLYDGR